MMRSSIAVAALILPFACADVDRDTDAPASADTTGFAGTTGGETEGAGVLTPAGFANRFGRATCARVFACCSPVDLRGMFATFPEPAVTDEEGCVEFFARRFARWLRLVAASEVAGRAEWDREAAAACVERVNAMSCEEYSAELAVGSSGVVDCPLLVAKVGEYGACRHDWECATGHCRDAKQWYDGTCADRPAVGEACPDNVCEDGAWCDQSREQVVCAALKADGAVCRSAGECRSNGCTAEVFAEGVCGEPRVCDGDLADDEDVVATCALESGKLRVECKIGSVGGWNCNCREQGRQVATCSPGTAAANVDVCAGLGCCAK